MSNPHGVPASFSVSWYDSNDIFDWTGQPRDVPLTIAVRTTAAAAPVYLWSSIVRNDMGDATFVAGQDVLD